MYVAAVAPLDGTKPYSLLSEEDEKNYFSGVNFDEKSDWMVIDNEDNFANTFASKPTSKQTQDLLRYAVNEPAISGEGIVSYSAEDYARIDKYYVFTTLDKIIPLESQKTIAAKIDLVDEVELATGHTPMVTNPEDLANAIEGFIAQGKTQ